MDYINVGVRWISDGAHVPTKDAMKRALQDAPATVYFYNTSPFGTQLSGRVTGEDIPEGVSLSVCGPDPSKKRDWWAQVSLNGKGRVKVD